MGANNVIVMSAIRIEKNWFCILVGRRSAEPLGPNGERGGTTESRPTNEGGYARNGGACARRLRFNSVNDVLPGGPVSRVSGLIEIFGGNTIASSRKSGETRSRAVGGRTFSGVIAVARRILQHSVAAGFGRGFVGVEWKGQALAVSGFFAPIALKAQWFEIAIQEQIVIAAIKHRAVDLTPIKSPTPG